MYRRNKREVKREEKEPAVNNITQPTNSFNWFDTGLLLAVLTALGYYIAYNYQRGFLSHFGVLNVLISQISLKDIIISSTVLGGGLTLGLQFIASLKNTPHSDDPFWHYLNKKFLPYILVSSILIDLLWNNWLILLGNILLSFIYLFILPILNYRHVKGYKNKLGGKREKQLRNGNSFSWAFYNLISNLWTRIIILLIVLTFILPQISFYFGFSNAKAKEDFLVYQNNQKKDFVVINSIGDKFISAPIDLSTNKIETKYQVIEQKSDMKAPLVFERVHIDGGIGVNSK